MINSLFSEFHQIMATSSCYLTHHHKSTQSWCLNSSLTIARLFLNIKILLMSEFIGCEIIMKLLIKLLTIINQESRHQNCRQYVRNGFRRKPTHAYNDSLISPCPPSHFLAGSTTSFLSWLLMSPKWKERIIREQTTSSAKQSNDELNVAQILTYKNQCGNEH